MTFQESISQHISNLEDQLEEAKNPRSYRSDAYYDMQRYLVYFLTDEIAALKDRLKTHGA
jgi:hypothetical protein